MSRFNAPIAEQIWDMKYRFKDKDGEPIDITVEDTWQRIARALAKNEPGGELTGFYNALEDWKFVPAGRIVAGAGTGRMVTLFNCFVMGTIPDSMDGIFSMLREAALTMQQGGGIGYDFSTIRPKTSRVKKLGADASGPLSFMDCWDAMCRTVMSAGSRRGAMMATMRCDHPDIEDFITAKQDPKRLRMFNMSVLITDRFMEAVEENEDWPLAHVEEPMDIAREELTILDHEGKTDKHGEKLPRYIHRIVKARDLWNLIMQSTYDAAEPGVIFIDRINSLNNLKHVEAISATNPCGEQPLPPYGACLLGSINLAKFVKDAFTDHATLDLTGLRETVATAIRMMDNVIDVSNFPLPQQREEAKNKRRIGLGVTGLADALIMLGLIYGSEDAAQTTEFILKEIALASYWASVELAKQKGPFPLFSAASYPPVGSHADMLCDEDPELRKAIAEHGIRNALLTSIAPTGTISLYAGNVSSGIEPMFAYGYTRKVLQPDGSKTEERVEDYAVAAYREFWEENIRRCTTCDCGPGTPEGGCVCGEKAYLDFDESLLPETFVTAQTLTPDDHLVMQAAAQKWVDSSISKTINLPEDISFEAFKNVYWEAYGSGCKGCTTYRPNEITGSVLSVDPKPETTTIEHWDPETMTKQEIELPSQDAINLRDTADFLVAVQDMHDENVRVWGKRGRERWAKVLEDYDVERAVDIDPQYRQGFLRDLKVPHTGTFTEMMEQARSHLMPEEEWKAKFKGFAEANVFPDNVARFFSGETPTGTTPEAMTAAYGLPDRPEALHGTTYKIKVGDQKAVYLTVNDKTDSEGSVRPFEIFLRSSDPTHDEWMVGIARTVSAVMRRGEARFIAEDYKRIHSTVTGGFKRGGGYQPSILAAIGSKLIEHMDALALKPKMWVMTHPGTLPPIHPEGFSMEMKGKPCPKCAGYNFKHEGGCPTCLDCGWSKCG